MASASSAEEEDSRWAPSVPIGGPEGGSEMLALMRDFLQEQSRREEGMLAELRHLRVSLPQTGQVPLPAPGLRGAAATPSTATVASPRLGLPTPLPRRERQYIQSPSLQSQDAGSGLDPPSGGSIQSQSPRRHTGSSSEHQWCHLAKAPPRPTTGLRASTGVGYDQSSTPRRRLGKPSSWSSYSGCFPSR